MNEKKLEKGFYFGYGKESFGYEDELFNPLIADLSLNEGCGIALIANKHIDFKNIKKIHINLKNNSNLDLCARIEKKFQNDVKTGFEQLSSNSSNDIELTLSQEDTQMKELVISLLKEDNYETTYSISTEISTY